MSSIVKTRTPFIDREILLHALTAVGCNCQTQGTTIITERKDYYGYQKFEFQNGRYVFLHDSSSQDMIYGPKYPWGNIDLQRYKVAGSFLDAVGKSYNAIYQKRLEELEQKRLAAIAEAERLKKEALAEQERLRLLAKQEEERKKAEAEKQRLEQERKAYVAKQKAAIIEKAKEQGYDIQETMAGNKIKLVLVQTTY